MQRPLALAAALILAAAACGGESPERQAARRDARRAACVAEELRIRARDRLAKLDTAVATNEGTPLESVTFSAHRFAAAYQTAVDNHARDLAFRDSALRVEAKEDSTRFAAEAARWRLPTAAAGSVEANAQERLQADMAEALANPNHPCNLEADEG